MDNIDLKPISLTTKVQKYLKFLLNPKSFYLYHKKTYNHHNISYSQEGEDLILARFFENQNQGFYIDVGAFHPQRFSNTYYFYLKGWRGINIDAMPNSMKLFNKLRPNDINLEIPISGKPEILTYYEFNEPALNGFDSKLSQERDSFLDYQIIQTFQLKTSTLAQVLDNFLPNNQKIDFINIDVEGLDYQVLKSNDWEKYRPKLILVENLSYTNNSSTESNINDFLKDQQYKFYAKTINTNFFINLDIE